MERGPMDRYSLYHSQALTLPSSENFPLTPCSPAVLMAITFESNKSYEPVDTGQKRRGIPQCARIVKPQAQS